MNRVFIIHGWEGFPEEGWFPWLKQKLESKNFLVNVPSMPSSSKPLISSWVNQISKIVGTPDSHTFFIGHSIGCQTIMRYLAQLNPNSKIGGVVFVAGWFSLIPECIPSAREKRIAKPWLETKIDFKKINSVCKNFVSIFSDNDPCVPLSDSKLFRSRFNSKIIIQKNKGHFCGEDNIKKLDVVLKEILRMSRITNV